MKKKIIFVLSFLMMVLCLTGCGSTNVTPDEIRKITEIAQNIKDNPNYELPEGYIYESANNNQNGQIVISTNEEHDKFFTLHLTFDITKEKVELLKVEKNDSADDGARSITIILSVMTIYMCILILWIGFHK